MNRIQIRQALSVFAILLASCSDESPEDAPSKGMEAQNTAQNEDIFRCQVVRTGSEYSPTNWNALRCDVLKNGIFINNIIPNQGNCRNLQDFLKNAYNNALEQTNEYAGRLYYECLSGASSAEDRNFCETRKSRAENKAAVLESDYRDWFLAREAITAETVVAFIKGVEQDYPDYQDFVKWRNRIAPEINVAGLSLSSSSIWPMRYGDIVEARVDDVFGECSMVSIDIIYIDALAQHPTTSDKRDTITFDLRD